MEYVVYALRRLRRRSGGSGAGDIDIHRAHAAAEGLLLARTAVYGGMPVLGAGLTGEKHHFLGADPVGIDVSNQLKAGMFQIVQAEIRHFDGLDFFRRQGDMRPFK